MFLFRRSLVVATEPRRARDLPPMITSKRYTGDQTLAPQPRIPTIKSSIAENRLFLTVPGTWWQQLARDGTEWWAIGYGTDGIPWHNMAPRGTCRQHCLITHRDRRRPGKTAAAVTPLPCVRHRFVGSFPYQQLPISAAQPLSRPCESSP